MVGSLPKRRAVLDAVAADDSAAWREESVARVPDDVDGLVQEGEAAVDVFILLPEAARLPGDLVGGIVAGVLDDGFHFGREVGINSFECGEGHGADAVVGIDGFDAAADAVLIGDAYAGAGLADTHDLRVVADDARELLLEGARNLVHAADGLEHGGLPVDDVLGEETIPQVCIEQRVHGQRIARHAGLRSGAGQHFVAGALGAGESAVGFEIAVLGEELEHALFVFCAELLIERALANAFREQLGDVAACVIDHLALLDRLAVVELVTLQKGGA